jgi:hypothetical protein
MDGFKIDIVLFEQAETGSQKTNAAKTSRRVGKDRPTALCTNSGCACHPVLLSIFHVDLYCPEFRHGLRLQHRNEMTQLVLDIARRGDSVCDLLV